MFSSPVSGVEKARSNLTISRLQVLGWVIVLGGLYLIQFQNYLLFHSLVELFSVVVGFSIWVLAWNSRAYHRNDYLTFLGVAYLFVAGLDLVHAMAFKGMGVFPGIGANRATQLWIGARYLESLALLIGPAFLSRRLNQTGALIVFSSLTALLVVTIFIWPVFPTCYLEGTGLTWFKKVSEYLISLILVGALIALLRKRDQFEAKVLGWLVLSILLTMGAELAFTFYLSVFGLSNMIGHCFKLISFYLIYRALVVSGLQEPYGLLFRRLKKKESEQAELIERLQNSLLQVRQLSGLLPICASCKRIRSGQGYWDQVEDYISQHSEADFTHSICPDCRLKLYPELCDKD